MGCRHCNTEEVESQTHLEICTGTKEMRNDLDMKIEKDQLAFRRKMSKKLRDLVKSDEYDEIKNKELRIKPVNKKQPINNKDSKSLEIHQSHDETVAMSQVVDVQEAIPATSREGWSHAAVVLRTPGTSIDAGILSNDPPL